MPDFDDRTYAPEQIGVAYTRHVIVEVETFGGVKTFDTPDGSKMLTLEHDERLFAGRGRIVAWGDEAALEVDRACTKDIRYAQFPPLRRYCADFEVLFEPKSETVVVPRAFSASGNPVVVLSVSDVLAIVQRDGRYTDERPLP